MKKNLKWILLAIAVAIIGIVIYFAVKESLREEVELTFPDTVIVENATNKDVDKIIKALVYNIFQYDTIKISVVYIPSHMEGTDKWIFNAFILKNSYEEKNYFIFLNKDLKPSQYKITLAHEIIHLDQYEKGDLVVVDNNDGVAKVIYKGDTLDYKKVPYEKRPHEIEAHKIDDEIFKKLEKTLYK